jgi:DNA replication licensing factor MCM4
LVFNFRFDLIYLLLDKIDSNEDRHLANHIARLYSRNSDLHSSDCLNRKDFHLYIKYGKSLNPILTDEAMKKLAECYISMRKINGNGGKGVVAATTRQLESLIRLSEAHARMRYTIFLFQVIRICRVTRYFRGQSIDYGSDSFLRNRSSNREN